MKAKKNVFSFVYIYLFSANGEGDKLVQSKPYDWTFSTPYCGSTSAGFVATPTTTQKIDVERLKLPDPILLYGELVLFEDELGDNGCSMLTVKTVKQKTETLKLFIVFKIII